MADEKLQTRSRAKKKMRKLQEINDFCESEYGEKIELANIKKRDRVICEKCGGPMNLLMDFGSHKIFLCSLCDNRSRK